MFADLAVLAVEACLQDWRGRALLTWRSEAVGGRLIADVAHDLNVSKD